MTSILDLIDDIGEPIDGVNTDDYVMLDFDDMPFDEVLKFSIRALMRFDLLGFIILHSSENNYHVVFDRPFLDDDGKPDYVEVLSIMGWSGIVSDSEALRKFVCMQLIKKYSTLRIFPKLEKPCPRVVYRYGSQKYGVRKFLETRKERLGAEGFIVDDVEELNE